MPTQPIKAKPRRLVISSAAWISEPLTPVTIHRTPTEAARFLWLLALQCFCHSLDTHRARPRPRPALPRHHRLRRRELETAEV